MQIHLILGLNGPESVKTLGANIARIYPNRSRPLRDGTAWLVADDSTASIVSNKLGVTSGEGGISALVTTMSDYFGRAEPDLWSWIKVQWEAPPDASENSANAA
jgi:hypothetical protein